MSEQQWVETMKNKQWVRPCVFDARKFVLKVSKTGFGFKPEACEKDKPVCKSGRGSSLKLAQRMAEEYMLKHLMLGDKPL